jgi:hypothetical protein
MAQTYPKQVISSELTTVSAETQTKINELLSLFATLIVEANS